MAHNLQIMFYIFFMFYEYLFYEALERIRSRLIKIVHLFNFCCSSTSVVWFMLKVCHEYYVYNDLKKNSPQKLLVIPQLTGNCWKSCCYNVGTIRELRSNIMLYCHICSSELL